MPSIAAAWSTWPACWRRWWRSSPSTWPSRQEPLGLGGPRALALVERAGPHAGPYRGGQPGNDIVFNDEPPGNLRPGQRPPRRRGSGPPGQHGRRPGGRRSHCHDSRRRANHYRCELPPGSGGFQQDTFYRITAGDATTQNYKLEVQTAPRSSSTASTTNSRRTPDRPIARSRSQGDIKALEGTLVTIHATANMDIQEAQIDLNCDGLQRCP